MNLGLRQQLPEERPVKLSLFGESIDRYSRAADLDALIRLRDAARTVALEPRGRSRRKAKRVARKADAAIEKLRRDGVETEAEREQRKAEEEAEARRRAGARRRQSSVRVSPRRSQARPR